MALYDKLFKHLLAERGLTLFESEMDNIVSICEEILDTQRAAIAENNAKAEKHNNPAKVNAFDTFKKMNESDAKNKTEKLVMSISFVSAKTAHGGGHITMGVPHSTILQLLSEPRNCVLFIYKKADFDAAEKELKNE